MEYLFLILFLVAIVYGVVGLIKPNFLQSYIKRPLTRKQNLLIYGMSAFLAFIGVGVFAPPVVGPQQVVDDNHAKEMIEVLKDQDAPSSTEAPKQVIKEEVTQEPVSDDLLHTVTRVIDGDTIEVLIDGEKKTVRYIGINTPETVHPSKPVECFGVEASNKNKELVAGKNVKLVKDVSETDKYGRLLRYVYVDGVFVNHYLVFNGYAQAASYPPDVAYNEDFRSAQQDARISEKGLWGDVCKTVASDSEQSGPVAATAPATQPSTPVQCTIKGNINSDDEKIYHTVGCDSYSKTIIDESAGEQWFCTESDALQAGWRKALNC